MSTDVAGPTDTEQDVAAPQPDDYTAALDVASHANDTPPVAAAAPVRWQASPKVIMLIVAVVLAIAAVVALTLPHGPNLLQRAADTCKTGTLSDKNTTLLFDMAGKEAGTGTGSYEDYQCLVTALDTPTSTQTEMGKTRALDGRQTDTWKADDGTELDASWSYHPDNGLDLIITIVK